MAKKKASPKPSARRQRAAGNSGASSLQFSQINAALGVAGLLTICLGYYLLAQGSITAAPLLLVLGYVILLPMALIL